MRRREGQQRKSEQGGGYSWCSMKPSRTIPGGGPGLAGPDITLSSPPDLGTLWGQWPMQCPPTPPRHLRLSGGLAGPDISFGILRAAARWRASAVGQVAARGGLSRPDIGLGTLRAAALRPTSAGGPVAACGSLAGVSSRRTGHEPRHLLAAARLPACAGDPATARGELAGPVVVPALCGLTPGAQLQSGPGRRGGPFPTAGMFDERAALEPSPARTKRSSPRFSHNHCRASTASTGSVMLLSQRLSDH